MSKQTRIRWALALAAVLSFAICVALGVSDRWKAESSTWTRSFPFNDLTKLSVEQRLASARSAFDLGLLLLAALWSLLIAKKDEAGIVLSDHPELLMFTAGSSLLLYSLVSYFFFLNDMAYFFRAAGVLGGAQLTLPDIDDPSVRYQWTLQRSALGFGFVNAVLTLFSAHVLKERKI